MARVNVFLKDELLKAIDAEAAQSRTNRSALIQSVLTGYLEARRREREEAEIRREMEEACRGIRDLCTAAKVPAVAWGRRVNAADLA